MASRCCGRSEESASGSPRGAQVWVLHDRHPVSVAISTGLDDDTHTEVLTGSLQPGDMVIVDTATLPEPIDVPVMLPCTWLEARPDVRVALAQLPFNAC